MNKNILAILDLLKLAERLKSEHRHSWLSSGRQESVAEHTWQMALMAILVHNHLEAPVDLCRTLKMIIVHDLVEAEAGDVPFFEKGSRKKQQSQKEQTAIENIRQMIGAETGQDIYNLFQEFEQAHTPEAKLAKALDHLEVQIQHNLADFSSWEEIEYDLVYTKMDEPCSHDAFLQELCYAVQMQAEEKMKANGVDVLKIKRRL